MKVPLICLASVVLVTSCKHNDPALVVSASFTTPAAATATEALQFQNTSHNAASYAWDFGDRTSEKATSPTHTYAKAGTYQVTLHAYGANQDSASTTQSLVVGEYDVFAHNPTVKIAGTYTYKLYRRMNYSLPSTQPNTYTYLRSGTATVTQTSPSTVLFATPDLTTKAVYAPNASATPVELVPEPNIQFLTELYQQSLLHFYTKGDSLILIQYTRNGHSSATIDYYRGRRQ